MNAFEQKRQLGDQAFRMISRGLDLDESNPGEAITHYTSGLERLNQALQVHIPPEENTEAVQDLVNKMETNYAMTESRIAHLKHLSTAPAAQTPPEPDGPAANTRSKKKFGLPSIWGRNKNKSKKPKAPKKKGGAKGKAPAPPAQPHPGPTSSLYSEPVLVAPVPPAPGRALMGMPPAVHQPQAPAAMRRPPSASAVPAAGRGFARGQAPMPMMPMARSRMPLPGRGRGAPVGGMDTSGMTPEQRQRALARLRQVDQKMQDLILKELVLNSPGITFDDIVGLDTVKQALTEMVVLPAMRPEIFTGLRTPPRGLLLFGPPGNGKTMVARALATMCNSKFFAVSAASLMSKYVGEGEKIVRALFTMAAVMQPSIIFIDEIDAVLSARSSEENEASRRLKTEFLVQLDGVGTSQDDRVVLIGATNRPQDLDDAVIRRLPRRIYLPLPNSPARQHLMTHLVSSLRHSISAREMADIASKTENFSFSDLSALCKDAALGPIREVNIMEIDPASIRPIAHRDFVDALKHVRASVTVAQLSALERWNHQHGSAVV